MITSPLRTLCRWSFSQLARQKTILLSYMTPLSKFTFLSCNLDHLPSQKHLTNISSSKLINFVTSLRNKSQIIRQIQAENYGFIDVLEIQKGGRSSAQSLTAHRQQIKQMGSQFEHLTQQILESINEVHIIQWMQVCWKLQILDIAVWNRLLTVLISCFLKLEVQAQHTAIKLTHQFIKQKFMAYNHAWSKFIYRQNLLVDLINFKAFFAVFFKSLTNPHQNPFKEANFQLVILLIEKVGKVCILNFMDMLRHYRGHEAHYLAVLEGKNLKTAIQFLKFYAIIGLSDEQRLLSIESHIYQIWTKESSPQQLKLSQYQYSQQEKCEQTLSIVSAWNSLCHYNTKLYHDLLRPVICRQLQNSSNVKYFYNWLYNIVGCQLEDWQLIEHLANKIALQFPQQNKNIHIIHHYLSVKRNIKTLSNFACSQNNVTLGIINNCTKIYSNCMTKPGKSLVNKSSQFHNDIRFQKEIGFQKNPAQQFWMKILQKAFNRLKEKYPKSTNQIHQNFEFCVFQIDALVILDNQPIAFELIGTHYKLKTIDEKDDEKKIQGKKIIKYRIIAAYGIKLLQIDSTKMIERTINTLQEEQGGVTYLCERITALLAE